MPDRKRRKKPGAPISVPIEDYGIIGNAHTAALVSRGGSIDWLCLPRFDSESVFGALLGNPGHGRWLIAPEDPAAHSTRQYCGDTGILQTSFETAEGCVTIIDFMPVADNDQQVDVIRLVRGDRGSVRMHTEIILRFDYGRAIPWVRQHLGGPGAMAGPNAVQFTTPVALKGTPELTTVGEFTVSAGETVPFTMSWYPSHHKGFRSRDPQDALLATENWWLDWSSHCTLQGKWRDPIIRSLITLKMLTYEPTGGIVAAATTSLPEWLGGVRNWDYRICWIRDATLTLYALLSSGYRGEARAWREWLLRAAAGDPSDMQIMYGLSGERRLTEYEIPWLPGYADSRPVRIGNAAYQQLQIDVYGELIDALYAGQRFGLEGNPYAWNLIKKLLEYLERLWQRPDQGIWEVRGPARHFTFSKIMAWVAFDRAIKSIEQFGLEGPKDHWNEVRVTIAAQILDQGYDPKRNTFVQYYGARDLDASLLLIPQLGFLPPDDSRVHGTIAAIERDLVRDGFVCRYPSRSATDGLPEGEGVFLACSFWLANSLALIGRRDDAIALFERLLAVRNDLGLLSEEYDPVARRLLGNFPQAFSHTAIINTAAHLAEIETASVAAALPAVSNPPGKPAAELSAADDLPDCLIPAYRDLFKIMSNPPAPQRVNNFDAVRLAAALSVVFSHSFLIAEGSEANEPFARITGNQCILGLVGVFVFFVISGYLVTESYCRNPAPGRFAVRRMLRIYPGLVVNVLVCALLIGPLVTTLPLGAYLVSPEFRQFLVDTLTMDPGPLRLPGVLFADNSVGLLVNGSLWTLRYEVMMYLMILLLGVTHLLRLSCAIILVGVGIAAVYFEQALTPWGDIGEWAWFVGFFAAGMVLSFLRDRLVFDWRYALLAMAGLVAFAWLGRLIMLFPLAGAYLVIYLARRHERWLDYSRYLGDLSYGLYIYGWPAEQLVMYLSGGRAQWWQVFFGSLAIALPAAWLSWHGIEKWALLWGRRLPGQRLAAAAGE